MMAWNEILEIVKPLGYFGLALVFISSLAAYLGKKYIEHIADINQLKKSLLHEKRVLIVAGLYKRVNDLWRAMSNHIGMKPENILVQLEISKKAIKAAEEFRDFYQDNEIWFPEEICSHFYKLNDEMINTWKEQTMAENPALYGQNSKGFRKAQESFTHCDKVVRPAILKHFRDLLGVK